MAKGNNKNAAFGLRPVGTLSGSNNLQTNEYFIADNEASSMFQGDPIIQQASNTGFVDIGATGSTTNIGVLNGVQLTLTLQRENLNLQTIIRRPT